ncbi:uncharacterized protein [Drosophila tropicalis]|uniref:uncharacterized protein n=1 Tax=Drosophila tropicalis TaxID=46794 RepID=UPI0035AB6D5B
MTVKSYSAFRTISDEAAFVIAGLCHSRKVDGEGVFRPRVDPNAHKRSAVRNGMDASLGGRVARDASTKGRWTWTPIPNNEAWIKMRHGQVNFYLTQKLSGHGCFRSYLKRCRARQPQTSAALWGGIGTAEHVVFYCPRYDAERRSLNTMLGEGATPSNLEFRRCKLEERKDIRLEGPMFVEGKYPNKNTNRWRVPSSSGR